MNCTATLEETFADFLLSRRAKGLAEKTLESYSSQWKAVARHLDVKTDIALLQKADLDSMIVSMREAGLSSNSINSYTRTLKSFFSWCNEQGITSLNIPLYKAEETVKETYSDAELSVLLKKARHSESNLCRISGLGDYQLSAQLRLSCRHGSGDSDSGCGFGWGRGVLPPHKEQESAGHSPLQPHDCHSAGVWALPWRGAYGLSLLHGNGYTAHGERLAAIYRKVQHAARVQKTSIHLFRHTFARKYLIDCGGDAFTLQKLLGHSTLAMTKHYCAIYDADLTKNYDNFSPLAQMKAGGAKIKMAAKGR